ncbi:hypothetical protein CBM2606_A10149 [Cupriavidus taiwanensis]|nr:hypothetical protein CBM2606_A10149 [Cupriavidus taiwanensis]
MSKSTKSALFILPFPGCNSQLLNDRQAAAKMGEMSPEYVVMRVPSYSSRILTRLTFPELFDGDGT